ncbi:hypothetical protein LJC10_03100 [Selenomonadales bacterium OttesenSCG-928-I06]|nr:hypothetical protein [Selenomonadales bacterium OttesenSCG-928-I06]
MSKKERTEDKVLQALLTSRTIAEAAEAAQITERYIYKLLEQPDFNARFKAAREDIIRGIANHIKSSMTEAIETIVNVMRNTENRPNDRLSAAKTILEHGNKYIELEDVLERLKRLEDAQNEIQ